MFKDVLKTLRKNNSLTQAELAEYLGISPASIGMYEQGRRIPYDDILFKISKYFKISIDLLLDVDEQFTNAEKLSDDELELLQEYKKLDKKGKTIVLATCYQEQEKQNTKDFMLEVAKEIS